MTVFTGGMLGTVGQQNPSENSIPHTRGPVSGRSRTAGRRLTVTTVTPTEIQMLPRYLMFAVVVFALGCGGGALRGKSMDDIKNQLQGKDSKVVISLMGKPTSVTETGGLGGADEVWSYLHAARHPATGTKMTVMVQLRGGRVIRVDGM
jgi:hypothetical protein